MKKQKYINVLLDSDRFIKKSNEVIRELKITVKYNPEISQTINIETNILNQNEFENEFFEEFKRRLLIQLKSTNIIKY